MRWVLIDQLLECVPGRRAVAVKTFPMSDMMFVPGFQTHPAVPELLLIESVAQAAAKSLRLFRPDMLTMLVSIKSARFLEPVLAGDRCRIQVDIVAREKYAVESGVVDVDGVRALETELLVVFAPRPVVEAPEQDVIINAWRRRRMNHLESLRTTEVPLLG